jgi:hypothetical protein
MIFISLILTFFECFLLLLQEHVGDPHIVQVEYTQIHPDLSVKPTASCTLAVVFSEFV